MVPEKMPARSAREEKLVFMACEVGRSVTEVVLGVRTMRGLVAAQTPARALHQPGVVVLISIEDRVGVDNAIPGGSGGGCLQMAPQAEIRIAGDQHLLVNRAVWVMA